MKAYSSAAGSGDSFSSISSSNAISPAIGPPQMGSTVEACHDNCSGYPDVPAGAVVGTIARRARVPQPAASVHHAVCRPCDRRAVRDGGRHCLPVNRQESDQPARHSAHHGRAPVARGRGHQHDPRVARSRLDRHDQRVCRSGSGDEGPDARCVWILQLWEGGQASLAGRPVLDAVPPQPVRSAGYVT